VGRHDNVTEGEFAVCMQHTLREIDEKKREHENERSMAGVSFNYAIITPET
jgi:hypothetical protein